MLMPTLSRRSSTLAPVGASLSNRSMLARRARITTAMNRVTVRAGPSETRDLLNTLDAITKRGARFKSLVMPATAETATPPVR
jgi:hypothetical protein